jgi:RND family efflux transporter MFP subunit
MKLKSAFLITGSLITGATLLFLGTRMLSPSVSAQTVGTSTTPTPVTLISAAKGQDASMEFVGTVKAIDQIKILPATSGQIISSKVSNGDTVHRGDLLFEIGGLNGTEHPLRSQYDLVQTNFNNAQKALDAVKDGNDAALQVALLQVKSAQHQSDALAKDVGVYYRNIDAADSNISILRDNLDTTLYNNQQNLDKASLAIDTLDNSIQQLKVQKTRALDQLQDQLNDTEDQTGREKIQTQLDNSRDDFDQKIRDLNAQFQTAQISYNNATAAAQLAENQLQGQLSQSQAQQDVLNLNRDSLEIKAGYTGDSTDAVDIAKEGTAATQAKNKAALLQAQSLLDVAKTNLEIAKIQLEFLSVRAPVDGIIDQIAVRPGDTVGTQSLLAQIVNPKGFEMNIGVNPDDVSRINKAEIQLGGKYLDVPIKNISTVVDPSTKLVNLTLGLPNIFFRANQVLNARLTFGKSPADSTVTDAYMIPVDALVIADDNSKYVFLDSDGIARKTPVAVGNIDGDQVAITSGLHDNDQIIVEGSQDLTDGQTVVLK